MAKVRMLAVQSIDRYMIDNDYEFHTILYDEIVRLRDAATLTLDENASLSLLIDWVENED